MANEALLRAFLEDLALVEDQAQESARSLIDEDEIPIWLAHPDAAHVLRAALRSREEIEAFAKITQDLVHIALHSALVAIDGGSSSAEVGRVRLVDDADASLGDGLHEAFVDHLFDTGRMS